MSTLSSARLPKGSTILITGITGYIGSWVANEALSLGYKVRGAVRDRARASWQQKFFDDKFPSRYSQVLLRSILDVPALEAAVVGVDGIIHVAVDTNLNPEPEPYISQAVEGTLNVLRVAEKEASIKSVVLTMSSVGGVFSLVNTPFAIPKDNYNEEAVKLAYDPEFKSDAKHWIVYAASKAQAEKAAWKYVEEQKPHYAISTVLPSANFGPPLSIEHQGWPSTSGWPEILIDGDTANLPPVPPQHFIDVRDCARIHVAALVSPTAESERFWGFAEPYNYNQILAIFRKLWPQRKFIDDLPDMGRDLMTAPRESAEELLKVFGQDGWTSLQNSLRDAFDPLVTSEL